MMATTIVEIGTHVEIMPTAVPAMITVAGPVSACLAIIRVGLCS